MSDAATINVAVIIPTYNRRELLGRALRSVLSQSARPAEIIVVDDGSNDDTAAFVQEQFAEVKYIYQKNGGVSAARNLGVENTDADWIAFLDSDDEWLPQKLARQWAVLSSKPEAKLIHCDEIWIRNGTRVNQMNKHQKHGGDIFQQCLSLCAISPSAVLLQRALFDSNGGFDESLPACEDYDLWLRICSSNSVEYIDEPLLKKFGGHADQLSKKHWGMDRFRVQAIYKLVTTYDLSVSQRSMALATLQQKCAVLLAGARKRENVQLIEYCIGILNDVGIEHDS